MIEAIDASSSRFKRYQLTSCFLLIILNSQFVQSFIVPLRLRPTIRPNIGSILQNTADDGKIPLTFDQAGASLVDEDDQKKLEGMGNNYDANPDGEATDYETLRAALRSRLQSLGIEKSQVTAEYVERRAAEARKAGSAAAAAESNDMFGGLDLSKIRQSQTENPNAPDENLPSMLYEVDEMLTDEEKAIVDPVSLLPFIEQAKIELKATKWPTPWAALRGVVVVIVTMFLTTFLVVGWDNLVRQLYTDILHFIPTPEELADYTNRFDSLDLPPGWTDNMNEDDIAQFSEVLKSN